ncbi:MAG: hypothetical protein JWR50_4424 [Mucilaginibacter sp.]|nr:hypothetical protein [Mucilaginibacter sp.]
MPIATQAADDTTTWVRVSDSPSGHHACAEPSSAGRWCETRQDTFKSQPFLSTAQDHTPTEMLTWFIRRWTIEVMLGEVRRHLGVEAQHQWSNLTIVRRTPTLLGVYSLITM